MKSGSLISVLVMTFIMNASAMAADRINLRHQSAATIRSYLTQSAIHSLISMKETNREQDARHITHIRLQQMYAGYPVWGGQAVLHVSKNKKNQANGIIYQNLTADLGSVPSDANLQADKALQQFMQSYVNKTGVMPAQTNRKNDLMVYVDQSNKAHWAFLVSFYAEPKNALPDRPTYIVDEKTFQVYEQWNDVKKLDAVNGGGVGGNPVLGTLVYDNIPGHLASLEIMRDPTTHTCYLENENIMVHNARNHGLVPSFKCDAPSPEHQNLYWDENLDLEAGALSPNHDALYLGTQVMKMYQDWFHVPVVFDPLDKSKPMRIHIWVHYMAPMYFAGAWVSPEIGLLLEDEYREGNTLICYPAVAPDVVAHELGHGFTEQHSNLVYMRQSGGLNESFSDMAAQAFLFYSTGKNDWMIMQDFVVPGYFDYLGRYMDDPTRSCTASGGINCSIGNAKDYDESMDVHMTSGVFNKAFYLLSTSPGWDVKQAFAVMVKANQDYWTPTSDFQDAACGVLDAAVALGDSGDHLQAVSKAMEGVGIMATPDSCKAAAPNP